MVKTAFTVLLMVSLLGIAACGGDDEDAGGTTAAKSDEPILIKTHVGPNARGETVGEVLSGSTIGDSAFCAGGTFIDAPTRERDPQALVRSFRCSGGTLTITFSTTQPGLKQSGDWKVVKGLARFEGLSGGGRMRAVFESKVGEGRETFTGTVTR